MNSKSLEDIIELLNEKSENVTNKLEEIKHLDSSNLKMNYQNVGTLVSINDNLNIINDKLEDIRLELLNLQNQNTLTFEQKMDLREFKFQNILKNTFYPYILYLKLCTEID